METNIPSPLKNGHEYLHKDLSKAMKLPGKTGVAAKRSAALLHAHLIQGVVMEKN